MLAGEKRCAMLEVLLQKLLNGKFYAMLVST